MAPLQETHIVCISNNPRDSKVLRRDMMRLNCQVTCHETTPPFLKSLLTEDYDVLIAEINGESTDGISMMIEVRKLRPGLPVIMLVNKGNVSLAIQALRAGARDVIEGPWDRKQIVSLIRSIVNNSDNWDRLNGKSLTKGQKVVLRLIVEGHTNKDIALLLHRSVRTIEEHRRQIMSKFNVHNVVDLVKVATFSVGPNSPDAASRKEAYTVYD